MPCEFAATFHFLTPNGRALALRPAADFCRLECLAAAGWPGRQEVAEPRR
jgi:hypothetical protein